MYIYAIITPCYPVLSGQHYCSRSYKTRIKEDLRILTQWRAYQRAAPYSLDFNHLFNLHEPRVLCRYNGNNNNAFATKPPWGAGAVKDVKQPRGKLLISNSHYMTNASRAGLKE